MPFHRASEIPIGALQAILQPHFPAWQHNLQLPETEFRDGLYIFKAALDKSLWRRIAIPGEVMLEEPDARQQAAQIIEKQGQVPEQYPNWDGDNEDWDDAEEEE